MSGKVKDNPGSGQIWNLILGVFRGEAVPNCSRNFRSVYIFSGASSGQRLHQNSIRTLLRQHSMQQRQVSKRLPTADHPRNVARNDVPVWVGLL